MTFHRRFLPFIFVAFFISIFPAFSAGGVLAGSSSPLHVIRTEYFDIIFPEECIKSAKRIEAVCDDYYVEICSLLETEPYQRFPVTITRSVEVLNAYYATIPYNRIVLFDTVPEANLDMYEETILSIFYHELTHAVTYNIKPNVLKKLSFFADCLNPAWLTVTTFWAEGATVSFESKGRGGRLNNPFSTQIVNQSKIEGHFPSWRDVTGARDTYPGGTDAYMFGSMFASYLQETYGMSKYAEFWKNAGSSFSLSFIAGVFKKTYGIKITDAWKDFEKTLDVSSGEKKARLLSHKKSRVTTFDAFFDKETSEVKIAFFDILSASLRLLTLDADGKIKKNKKLLAINGLTRVSFSPDGKKLALTCNVDKKTNKCVTAEYDIQRKKFIQHPETGRREGFYKFKDGNTEFSDFSIKSYYGEDSDAQKIFKDGEIPFSPVGIDENLNVAIVKSGLSWKIRFFDDETSLFEYDFSDIDGKNLILHEIHKVSSDSSSILLSFSWAELGQGGKMLSRAGLMKIKRSSNEAVCFLQKENSFAGVIEAIPEKLDGDSFFFYISAAEYDKNPLYRVEMKLSDFEQVRVKAVNQKIPANNETFEDGIAGDSELPSSAVHSEISYNPFRYYKRGIFLPLFGFVPVYNHNFGTDTTTIFGMTFDSTNPWGDRRLGFSAGYDPFYNKYGASLSLSGGDDSLQYQLDGTCVFDKDKFMQTCENLQLKKILWNGRVSYFGAGVQGKFLYGRQMIDEDIEIGRDETIGKCADGIVFLQFSNIHKISPSVFNEAGFMLQPFVFGSYRTSDYYVKPDEFYNAGAKLQVRFPIIVPFIFVGHLFPSKDYVAGLSSTAVLADFEIHKGVPAVSLFIQRMIFTVSYEGKIAYLHGDSWDIKRTEEIFKNVKEEDYSDALKFAADLYFSGNTGCLATEKLQLILGYTVIYRPNPRYNEKRTAFGFTARANY